MKKILIILLCLILIGIIVLIIIKTQDKNDPPKDIIFDVSEYYGGYYNNIVSWTDGEDLKNQLHELISGGTYHALTYTSPANWETNQYADQDLYDFEYVDVLYSANDELKTDTTSKWSREHAFCASLMTGSLTADAVKNLGRATDYHNLFAANASANSSHGNKNFGVADKTSLTYTDRTTSAGKDGYSFDPVNFEPGDIDKGRIARAIFYMGTMYKDDEEDTINNITMKGLTIVEEPVTYVSGNNCAFAIGNLSTLLVWAKYDVDRAEYQHNEQVYSHVYTADGYAQGNRNPYVDYPDLVDYVYGDKKDQPGELKKIEPSEYTLKINDSSTANYAIESAPRQYDDEGIIKYENIKIVEVKNDFTTIPYNDFSVIDHINNSVLHLNGNVILKINTPLNILDYACSVHTDDIRGAAWYYETNENDYYTTGLNSVTRNNIHWDITLEKQAKSGTSQVFGIKYGTNTNPVSTFTIETDEEFTHIKSIRLRGSAASGASYTVKIYINDVLVKSTSLGYVSQSEAYVTKYDLPQMKDGTVKIVISNITKAIYISGWAIDYD